MHHKGFTLVELLVYIGVSTIVLLVVTGLVFSTLASYSQARAVNAQSRAFEQIFSTLQTITQEVYAVDPASDLNTSLTQTGTEVMLLSQSGTPNTFRLFMTDNTLYLESVHGTASLHSPKVRFTECIVTAHTQGKNGMRMSCTAESDPTFGLPTISNTFVRSFVFTAYEP